ncbi:DUF5753 domain-containing protein [Actinophytocola sp.]|uniref:DUF5753 domain-containing protein n=1 Tax=Actinophytocola sp. TaxID=1872138 RepID=UPI002ED1C2C9
MSVDTQGRLTTLTETAYNEVHPWGSALRRGNNLQESIQDQESTATRIRIFQPSVVPGLLQTAEYARRVIAMFHGQYSDTEPAAEIASRLNRQLALYETDRHFEFLITEAALRWRPGPLRLLLAQLHHIASLSTLDNVRIGLIPLGIEATTLNTHGFALYEGGGQDAWASVETIHAEMKVSAPEHLDVYRSRWSRLCESALVDEPAQEFLSGLVTELRAASAQ